MITKTMKLSDIKISDAFARTHVSERKLQKCRDYFEKFEKADRDIVLSSNNILIDGYIMYLVYKENNIEEVEVILIEIIQRLISMANTSMVVIKCMFGEFRMIENTIGINLLR